MVVTTLFRLKRKARQGDQNARYGLSPDSSTSRGYLNAGEDLATISSTDTVQAEIRRRQHRGVQGPEARADRIKPTWCSAVTRYGDVVLPRASRPGASCREGYSLGGYGRPILWAAIMTGYGSWEAAGERGKSGYSRLRLALRQRRSKPGKLSRSKGSTGGACTKAGIIVGLFNQMVPRQVIRTTVSRRRSARQYRATGHRLWPLASLKGMASRQN